MKLLDGQTGELVEVPDAQVPQAYSSGRFGLPKGQPLHIVGPDGVVGSVESHEAQAAFADGARLASPQEYRDAYLAKKYGGLGDAAAATGEGLARGVTLGISDPLAVGAARLFGGDSAAEKVREHLRSEKEAHGILSTGGEVVGAAAPILLSGGAGAAGEVGTLGRVAEGVRTLGAMPRGVAALGDAAEHAVSGMLGATSETALGAAAKGAAKTAARAVAEGGLYGAGQAVDESTLQNHELTAEKLFSTVGHAALTAGAIGAGLGAAGPLARRALSGVSGFGETLDDAAGEQAWKWLSPRAAESREATRRAGGTAAVGQTVLDEVLKPLIDQGGLRSAAISAPEKLALVQEAVDRKGAAIGELLKAHEGVTVKLGDFLRPIDEAIGEHGGRVLGEERVSQLQKLRASVLRLFGDSEEVAGQATERVRKSGDEVAAYLREHPEAADSLRTTGKLPDEAIYHPTSDVPSRALDEIEVPIGDAIAQRRNLQRIAFGEAKALDPNQRVQMLRDISGAWNDLEEKTLDRATSKLGEAGAGAQLRELNKTFQQLKIAEAAAEKTTAAYGANATFSLGDKIFGGAHMAGALASGHPVAAAGSIATMYGHKWLRQHGNAYAAVLLDRLSTLGGMSEATMQADRAVDASVERLVSSPSEKRLQRVFHSDLSDDRYDAESDRARQLATIAPPIIGAHLAQQTAGLSTHSPEVAQAVAAQTAAATKFLASKLPPTPLPGPLTPGEPPPKEEKRSFLRYVDAVHGGPAEILKRIAAGTQTKEDLETLDALYPHSKQEIASKILAAANAQGARMPYQTRLRLSAIVPGSDPTLEQGFLASMQQAYASGAHAAHSTEPGSRRQPSSAAIASMKQPDLVAGTFQSSPRRAQP